MRHALGRAMMPQQLVQVVIAKVIVIELQQRLAGFPPATGLLA